MIYPLPLIFTIRQKETYPFYKYKLRFANPAAIYNKTLIMVLQKDSLLEYSDVIQSQTEDSITLDNGDKYFRLIVSLEYASYYRSSAGSHVFSLYQI